METIPYSIGGLLHPNLLYLNFFLESNGQRHIWQSSKNKLLNCPPLIPPSTTLSFRAKGWLRWLHDSPWWSLAVNSECVSPPPPFLASIPESCLPASIAPTGWHRTQGPRVGFMPRSHSWERPRNSLPSPPALSLASPSPQSRAGWNCRLGRHEETSSHF